MNDIKLVVRYDNEVARRWFDDNFHTLCDGVYQYVDDGNLPTYDDDETIPQIRHNNSNANKLAKYIAGLEYTDYTFKDALTDLTIDEMIEYVSAMYGDGGMSYELLEDIYLENKITYSSDFIKIETRGHSQGDYAEVWVNKKDYKEVIGVKLDENILKKQIDNLFWDCPITCRITVNEEDYYIDENINDLYEYNKDEIYKICEELFKNHKEKKHILKYVKENLPNQLEA